jgi:hypothetical protein
MNRNRLIEEIDIVALVAINADFNADVTGDYVNLKNYAGALVVIIKPAGTAGDDLLLTLKQAADITGTGVKALSINSVYAKVGTQTGVNTFTRYDLTTPGTFDTSSVTGNSFAGDGKPTAQSALDLNSEAVEAMFVIDVAADMLDVNGGFNCISYFNDGSKVANALLANVLILPYGARFPGQIPLSSVVA